MYTHPFRNEMPLPTPPSPCVRYPCVNSDADATDCLSLLSTPTVVEMGQKYFNCPTLTGVELENQDGACGFVGG
jgi:hypothetical protein